MQESFKSILLLSGASRGLGAEHEKCLFFKDGSPVTYYAKNGIRQILKHISNKYGGRLLLEGDNPIAWFIDNQSITLEPGCQFELSGKVHPSLKSLEDEFHNHNDMLRELHQIHGIYTNCLGANPLTSIKDLPLVPKKRYSLMRPYLEKVGPKGVEMMMKSTGLQANIDYASEEEFIKGYPAVYFYSVLICALTLNSPFIESKPTGYLSNRAHWWRETDPERCGVLDFIYNEDFDFEKYINWILTRKVFFVMDGDNYYGNFEDRFDKFVEEKGIKPSIDFLKLHLSTVFPEVRAKGFFEIRSFDLNYWDLCLAIQAMVWTLSYNENCLEDVLKMKRSFSYEEFNKFYYEIPQTGLATKMGKHSALDLVQDLLKSVQKNIPAEDAHMLKPIEALIQLKKTPAEALLERWKKDGEKPLVNYIEHMRFENSFIESI